MHRMPMGKKISSLSTNKGNRKLPFDMGFKNIEKFFKNVNVSCSHQRAEVTEKFSAPETTFLNFYLMAMNNLLLKCIIREAALNRTKRHITCSDSWKD